jgi:hypothetical protein
MPARNTAQPVVFLVNKDSAEQITTYLKSSLQTVRVAFLTVGRLLDQVRQGRFFALLGYADIESYAEQRLRLGRTSLYKYLQVFDWVVQHHPEWLDPGPDTFIPDLNDAVDLIYIEKELPRKDLADSTRKNLEALKEKALKGELKRTDLDPYRRRTSSNRDWRKGFLSLLRSVLQKGRKLKGMPPEVIDHLERAIDVLSHATILNLAGMEDDSPAAPAKARKSG